MYLAHLEQYEFERQKESSRDLSSFARRAWEILEPAQKFHWNWHLDYIAEHLELVRKGMLRRLIVNVPPQTTKSRLITVFFPSWWWSNDPARRFLSVSYSGGAQGLATMHSLERRRVLASDWYMETFNNFNWTQFTQQQYENDTGGRMIATSTGATATGKGFHVIIIDDILNPKKAESEAERLTALKFFDETLRSRLSDQVTGSFIVVEQRTHEHDLTGHLLEREKGEWTHISMPMIAEEDEVWKYPISGRVHIRKKGELLWPERFPQWVCGGLQVGMGTRAWGAQYQQRPSPAEGIIFNPSHWNLYVTDSDKAHDQIKVAPTFDDGAITVDCTFKDSVQSDLVGLQAWCFSGMRNYLIKIDTDRMGYSATKMAIRALKLEMNSRGFPCNYLLVEDKANGSAVVEELKKEDIGMSVIALNPEGGKIARAWAAQPEQEVGHCYLPEDYDKTPKFIGDCAKFPAVDNDDDIDAFTQLIIWRRMRSNGLFELWAQEYRENLKNKGRDPDKMAPEELAQMQHDAQMEEAHNDPEIPHVFGAQRKTPMALTEKVGHTTGMNKVAHNEKTEACPECGSIGLSRCGVSGISGDIEISCACGWKKIDPRK